MCVCVCDPLCVCVTPEYVTPLHCVCDLMYVTLLCICMWRMRVAESMLMQVEQRLQPVIEDLVGIGRVGTLIKGAVGVSQVGTLENCRVQLLNLGLCIYF